MRRADERALSAVPAPVMALLGIALAAQIAWSAANTERRATAVGLPVPPRIEVLRVVALGQPDVLARALMLWLQAFDYQPGISVAFRDLDYARLEAWLGRILELDPAFQYPLLVASRVYAEVPDPDRQRRMLAFVAREFEADPQRRWPWMAHAVYVAKHRLGDLRYALELANRLARAETGDAIPNWARQMQIFVLEDLGEIESAKILLGGLLESGEITDPHERHFLSRRLHDLGADGSQSSPGAAASSE